MLRVKSLIQNHKIQIFDLCHVQSVVINLYRCEALIIVYCFFGIWDAQTGSNLIYFYLIYCSVSYYPLPIRTLITCVMTSSFIYVIISSLLPSTSSPWNVSFSPQ